HDVAAVIEVAGVLEFTAEHQIHESIHGAVIGDHRHLAIDAPRDGNVRYRAGSVVEGQKVAQFSERAAAIDIIGDDGAVNRSSGKVGRIPDGGAVRKAVYVAAAIRRVRSGLRRGGAGRGGIAECRGPAFADAEAGGGVISGDGTSRRGGRGVAVDAALGKNVVDGGSRKDSRADADERGESNDLHGCKLLRNVRAFVPAR